MGVIGKLNRVFLPHERDTVWQRRCKVATLALLVVGGIVGAILAPHAIIHHYEQISQQSQRMSSLDSIGLVAKTMGAALGTIVLGVAVTGWSGYQLWAAPKRNKPEQDGSDGASVASSVELTTG